MQGRGRLMRGITRAVSESLARCELTFVDRGPIDVEVAGRQHAEYIGALAWMGIDVIELGALGGCPDACFVEDGAVVVPELAVLTRMGAESRRAESATLEAALVEHRAVRRMSPPGSLDGGDVMRVGATVFVGRSSRTNDEGIAALAGILEPLGYRIVPVGVRGCLHLKTGCTMLNGRRVLINPEWVDAGAFEGFEVVETPTDEPWSGNVLIANGRALVNRGHPRAAGLVGEAGLEVRTVDISEFQKAEAGLTCLSILW